MKIPEIIVIGLDGAHWEILDPWIREGTLPNLKKIKDCGAWADMESCLPPVTSPNWKCYSTGKNPGKLGVFWWEKVDIKNRDFSMPLSQDYTGKEIWDYMTENGKKSLVINVPTTYPPHKINGVMISGGPSSLNFKYTYPGELEKDLKDRLDYKVNGDHNFRERDIAETLDESLKLIKSRFDAMHYLLEKGEYEFVSLTIFYINVFQHFFWNGENTKKAWKLIDCEIGKIMKKYTKSRIILVSDHGSNKIKWEFFINRWLEERGYLKLKKKPSFLRKAGISKENISNIPYFYKVKNMAKKIIPRSVIGMIPSQDGGVEKEGKKFLIEWDKSVAIGSGQGPVYIIPEDGKRRLVEKIREEMKNIRDPDGNKVVKEVYERDMIYSGNHLEKAPDLIIDQNEGYHINGGIGFEKTFKKTLTWLGENKRTGLFSIYGPGVRKGFMGKISILDVAPTILSLMGIKIPDDMDGKKLNNIVG